MPGIFAIMVRPRLSTLDGHLDCLWLASVNELA
jgi:hypothetical protein